MLIDARFDAAGGSTFDSTVDLPSDFPLQPPVDSAVESTKETQADNASELPSNAPEIREAGMDGNIGTGGSAGVGGSGGGSTGGAGGALLNAGGAPGTGGNFGGTGGMTTGGTPGNAGGTGGSGGTIGAGGTISTGGIASSSGGVTGTGGSTTPDAASVCTGYVGTGAGGLSLGLVAYYPCEQATGTTLPDLSGNGNDAILVTGTGGTAGYSFAAGKVGNALDLAKASKGYATLPAGLLSTACEATVATWVYINTSVDWQRIFDFGKDQNIYMYLTPSNSTTHVLRFAISASGNSSAYEQVVDGQAPLPTGTWNHVAVVLGSRGGILYLNGVQVGANTGLNLRPADLGNPPNYYIGRSQFSSDPYFDGDVDEFRLYGRALTQAEIQALASGS
jgi:hypothetical protein